MSKINVLSDIVANKIAAGEVVERPASVVKELVENSIDAGAKRITIDIEGGGRRLVRVADNGSGMGREDALLSIERHATSKIKNIEDIDTIATLGFRGEALPSIISVSKTIIDTRRSTDTFGTRLIIEGGVLKNVTDTGIDPGTIIEVRNLFFNVPARRKFLRSDDTELKHIKTILYDIAVSSPELDLTLNSDGRELFSYRGSPDKTSMLNQVFGESMARLLVPFDCSAEGVEITGFIGKPDSARNTSAHQYLVMNGRPIDSKPVARAVRDGYGPSLVRGMFPAFVLYFQAEPGYVDVNVHPMKREVRLHREYIIMQTLREQVAITIQSMIAAPELATDRSHFIDFSGTARPVAVFNIPPDRWHADKPKAAAQFEQPSGQTALNLRPSENMQSTAVNSSKESPFAVDSPDDVPHFESPTFWQLKDRYIFSAVKEGGIIIDQHVAHERILFEEVLAHFHGRQASAQQLLFPLVIDFPAADYDVLEPMIPFLNQIGFGIQEFGERSVMVDAVPSWFKDDDPEKIFAEYIDEMRVHGRITSGYIEKLAAAVACRSAIKAGKPLNQEEMQYLVDRLFATSSPFVCPHGRPVIVKLTLDELDRRFGR